MGLLSRRLDSSSSVAVAEYGGWGAKETGSVKCSEVGAGLRTECAVTRLLDERLDMICFRPLFFFFT